MKRELGDVGEEEMVNESTDMVPKCRLEGMLKSLDPQGVSDKPLDLIVAN